MYSKLSSGGREIRLVAVHPKACSPVKHSSESSAARTTSRSTTPCSTNACTLSRSYAIHTADRYRLSSIPASITMKTARKHREGNTSAFLNTPPTLGKRSLSSEFQLKKILHLYFKNGMELCISWLLS